VNRKDLEHIIRASADITEQYEFVVVGSQSLLAQIPSPEPELIVLLETMPVSAQAQ
jgi:hypothetical protein